MKQRVLKHFDGWTFLEHCVILSFLQPTPVTFKWLWKACLNLKKTGKVLMTWKEFTRSERHQCQVDFFFFRTRNLLFCSSRLRILAIKSDDCLTVKHWTVNSWWNASNAVHSFIFPNCCSVRVRGGPLDGWGLLWISVPEWSEPHCINKVHKAPCKLPGHWGNGEALPGWMLSAGWNGGLSHLKVDT